MIALFSAVVRSARTLVGSISSQQNTFERIGLQVTSVVGSVC